MVFSSYLFVFAFLPIFLSLYWLSPRFLRNAMILAASIAFYAIGEGAAVAILLVSVLGNFAFGRLIGTARANQATAPARSTPAQRWLVAGILFNLGMLGYYKYAGFLSANLAAVATHFDAGASLPVLSVALPLGISFFVFQGMSYLIDIYRGTTTASRNLLDFATYKTLFPQLVAGPIVRYQLVADELRDRRHDADIVQKGIARFMVGFCKKVLIADNVAVVADAVFALPAAEVGMATAWLGAIAYALQIYFDFSAYSDMAIGLGLMMGFHFPENFNDPYVSRSIREFWRRWHITLSTWFRDYVYVPLGGSRNGNARTYVNLLIVFLLTGLWHGAAWTFVAWGLWHGLFILMERAARWDERRVPLVLRHAYALIVVLFGWVLFRATDFGHAGSMMLAMCGFGGVDAREFGELVDGANALAIGAGIVLCVPAITRLGRHPGAHVRRSLASLALIALFLLACMRVLSGAYSPFLYFRF